MQMQFFFLLKKHEKPAVHVFRHLRKNLTLKKEKEFKKYSRYSTSQNSSSKKYDITYTAVILQ